MSTSGVVKLILVKGLKMTQKRVDFVLDVYESLCIKDIAREMWADGCNDEEDECYTFGGGLKIQNNFLTRLKSSTFKEDCRHFFFHEIRN